MKSISREHRIYILHPENEPAVTIDSGDDLMVETWDAFEGIREPGVLQEKSLKGPATGPIYVNGAEPGDTPSASSSSASNPRKTRPTWLCLGAVSWKPSSLRATPL